MSSIYCVLCSGLCSVFYMTVRQISSLEEKFDVYLTYSVIWKSSYSHIIGSKNSRGKSLKQRKVIHSKGARNNLDVDSHIDMGVQGDLSCSSSLHPLNFCLMSQFLAMLICFCLIVFDWHWCALHIHITLHCTGSSLQCSLKTVAVFYSFVLFVV